MCIINPILSSPRTVFTIQYLTLLNSDKDEASLRKSINYYVQRGLLLNPRRGIYAKPDYNEQEMACAIYNPSYISLEYVLSRNGVTFQYSDEVTSVSYKNRMLDIDGKTYSFRRINPVLWANMVGINQQDNVAIATVERAFLDMLYLSAGNCYFDNLRPINKSLVKQLLPVYNSSVLTQRANQLLEGCSKNCF